MLSKKRVNRAGAGDQAILKLSEDTWKEFHDQ